VQALLYLAPDLADRELAVAVEQPGPVNHSEHADVPWPAKIVTQH
jgi:hypothetical protein